MPGRDRITGNRSVRSRSLAPLQRRPTDRDCQRCPEGSHKSARGCTRNGRFSDWFRAEPTALVFAFEVSGGAFAFLNTKLGTEGLQRGWFGAWVSGRIWRFPDWPQRRRERMPLGLRDPLKRRPRTARHDNREHHQPVGVPIRAAAGRVDCDPAGEGIPAGAALDRYEHTRR